MKKSRLCLIFLFIAICSDLLFATSTSLITSMSAYESSVDVTETTNTVSTTKSIISTTTAASPTRSITTKEETETTPTLTAAKTTASTTQTATTTTPTTTTSPTVIITTTTMPSTETTDSTSTEATTTPSTEATTETTNTGSTTKSIIFTTTATSPTRSITTKEETETTPTLTAAKTTASTTQTATTTTPTTTTSPTVIITTTTMPSTETTDSTSTEATTTPSTEATTETTNTGSTTKSIISTTTATSPTRSITTKEETETTPTLTAAKTTVSTTQTATTTTPTTTTSPTVIITTTTMPSTETTDSTSTEATTTPSTEATTETTNTGSTTKSIISTTTATSPTRSITTKEETETTPTLTAAKTTVSTTQTAITTTPTTTTSPTVIITTTTMPSTETTDSTSTEATTTPSTEATTETTNTGSTTKSIISTTTATSPTRSITTKEETETTPTLTAAKTTVSTTQTATTTTPTTTTSPTVIITTTTTMPSAETTDSTSTEATTMPSTEATTETTTKTTFNAQTTVPSTTKEKTASSYSDISTAGSMVLTTSTVPSTSVPVTGATYRPNLDNFIIRLYFKISIDLPFKTEFYNSSSREYKMLRKEVGDKLLPLYRLLDGFKYGEILGFRPGSTKALYNVDMTASSSDVTRDNMNMISMEIRNLTIMKSGVIKSISDDIDDAVANMTDKCFAGAVCGSHLQCEGGTTGSPFCACKPDYCQNGGTCNAYDVDTIICSCTVTDEYEYSGVHCEVSRRLSTVKKSTITTNVPFTGGFNDSFVPSTETPVTGTAYKPKLDKLTIKLDFKVKIGLPFKPEFNDSTSSAYKKLKTEFHDKLTPLYKNLTGFKSLTILGFRNGSTVADHQIDWDARIDVTSEKLYTVSDEIQNLTIANSTVKTSIRLYINAAIRTISDKCNAEDVCGSKFACIGGTTGVPSCVCKSNYCKNAGICNAVSKNDYMCSCPTTDDYVYSGDNCELRTRRGSTLRESTIIGLAAGLGGGVILMIIIIFAFHRCSKKKRNEYRERQSDAIDLPELSFPNLDKMRISQMAAGNHGMGRPNYGFEPEPMDLRYHRGYDHGRDQGTFFERRGKDMPPLRRREDDFDDTMSHTTYAELDAYDNPDSGMDGYILPCPDYAGSSNLRRSSYDQLDEPTDSKEYGQIRSRNDPSYQPLFSGNSRDGDSAYQRVKKDNQYLTVY